MGIQTSRYYVFGIEYLRIPLEDIFDGDRIDMVDHDSVVELESGHSQIASIVTDDDIVSKIEPFIGMVKYLVQIPVVPEGCDSDTTSNFQISIPFDEGW